MMDVRYVSRAWRRGFWLIVCGIGLGVAALPAAAANGQPVLLGTFNEATGTTVVDTTFGTGLFAISEAADETGVSAIGNRYGLRGESCCGRGVFGESDRYDAIEAVAYGTNRSALFAHHDGSSPGYGIFARSNVGTGRA